MLSLQRVDKTFGKLQALRGISLEFEAGKCYALVGPNGSGKTTLIKSVLGMVIPQRGQIRVAGKDIRADYRYREKIGYMPQIGRYPGNLTIGQLVGMMKTIRAGAAETDDQLLREFGLHEMSDKRMHTLSGGTRQKVSAALAFLFNAPILILDEPTAGLDPISAEQLREKIHSEKERGKLIIITSHILSDLDDLATDLVYLHEGSVQYNNPVAALKSETGETRLGKAIATLIRKKELMRSVAA